MDYKTDNRWSPGASGATVPEDAPAVYSARWIDLGDNTPADILADRQGFAYNDPGQRDLLIEKLLREDRMIRRPGSCNLQRDVPATVLVNHPEWKCYARRAGGYVYVDAWLTPTT